MPLSEPTLSELLFEYYLTFQSTEKKEVSQKEFANYIGVDDKYYNHIYRGRRKPSRQVVRHLAEFFNDLRFYDAAGFERPDPLLHYVQSSWPKLPNSIKKKISDAIGEYKGGKKQE